ncbi:MAG: hypothetical protein FJ296_08850 [Planctomycetes bacterium]|nr:hypothetical protein [Planctomycetota bacterium]
MTSVLHRQVRSLARPLALLLAVAAPALSAQADPPPTWTDLGGGTAGAAGVPVLEGTGSLFAGSTARLRLTGAQPGAAGVLAVSLASTPVPFVGGVLHAYPITAKLEIGTDADGAFALYFPAPALPEGLPVWFQAAVLDGAAQQGVALSNGLLAFAPPASFDVAGTYITAVAEAQAAVLAGWMPRSDLDWLVANQATLMTNGAALLDALTPFDLQGSSGLAAAPPPPPQGGGVISGKKWIWESLVGLDVVTVTLQIPWHSTECKSVLGTPSYAGNVVLGSAWVKTLQKWTQLCPPSEKCPEGATTECGSFQVCWKQKWLFATIASGCSPAETFCAPCP